MSKIHVLDKDTANQIAAGEVVERPASVIKELVENSIDAGSTEVEIKVWEAGLQTIIVRDNGEGMVDEDVEKAFFRHATSKIRTGRDLFKINSLGFRGEALPSIAAVSKVVLRTSANNAGYGSELIIEGGKIIDKREIAYAKGTEITVENIFYNTPARLKYMKTIQTELGRIIDYINRLSLAYPEISFKLMHNDHDLLHTNGDREVLHAIAAIYGSNIAKQMIKVENSNLDYKLTGYVSKPEITRSNKGHISFIVNGRYVKNFLLNQALIRGYKTHLMINRFPIAVLKIEMDPILLDVNVHPAKLEVRFSKEQELLKFIEESVYNLFSGQTFIREPIKHSYKMDSKNETQTVLDFMIKNFDREDSDNKEVDKGEREESFTSNSSKPKKSHHDKYSHETKQSESLNFIEQSHHHGKQEKVKIDQGKQDKLPLIEPIGQLEGTYIIAQGEEGLYLIDQHAAHERIRYESNLTKMNEETITSQELLIPITLEYTSSEMNQIESRLDQLAKIGISAEVFGYKTIMVRSVPNWMPKGTEVNFVEKMIEGILEDKEINQEALRKDLIANVSCKSAIKAHKYLTRQEMETLIQQLRNTNNPFSCPHGRPTIIHFSYYDIEKMFKRVV